MTTRRTVTDFAGIHIGTVDDDDRFLDYAGVHAGALGADLVVRDFEGIRIGRVAPRGTPRHARAEAATS